MIINWLSPLRSYKHSTLIDQLVSFLQLINLFFIDLLFFIDVIIFSLTSQSLFKLFVLFAVVYPTEKQKNTNSEDNLAVNQAPVTQLQGETPQIAVR